MQFQKSSNARFEFFKYENHRKYLDKKRTSLHLKLWLELFQKSKTNEKIMFDDFTNICANLTDKLS